MENNIDKTKKVDVNDVYPLTVIADRYGGTYSHAAYLAFQADYNEIPVEISGDDVRCMNFWMQQQTPGCLCGSFDHIPPHGHIALGKGSTIENAVNDLLRSPYLQIDE